MDHTPGRARGRLAEKVAGDPAAIAPHVDPAWREDFVVELRLLSVPGARIGDALLTVEAHVVEAGEPASEAFGDARTYAREIAAATGAAGTGWRVGAATVVSTLLGLVGMLVTVAAFGGWLDGGPVEVTTGELVGLAVLVLLASTLFLDATLRVVVEHRWLALLAPAVLVGVVVGLYGLFAEPLLTVPALPLGLAGVLLLVVSTVVSWFDGPADGDRITAPGQGRGPVRGVRVFSALVLPLMTLLLLALTWALHAILG